MFKWLRKEKYYLVHYYVYTRSGLFEATSSIRIRKKLREGEALNEISEFEKTRVPDLTHIDIISFKKIGKKKYTEWVQNVGTESWEKPVKAFLDNMTKWTTREIYNS